MSTRSKLNLMWLLVVLALLVTACGSDAKASNIPSPESVGDPEQGAQIFVERHGEAPSCSFCHSVNQDKSGIGPSLEGIARSAGHQQNGVDTIAYLRDSIVNPNAFVADGSSKSRMYAHFDDVLSDEEIDNLIAYLLTLK